MDIHTSEIWRECPSLKGYEVSSFGNARRKGSKQNRKLNDNGKGYLTLQVILNGKHQNFYVHRLVAETFLKAPDSKRYVNHISCDTHNNHVSNLEWVTQKENMRHASELGRLGKSNKGKLGKAHHNHKTVFQYDMDLNLIKEWDSVMDIERELKIRNGHISECCNGKRKHVKGYIWKYKPISKEVNNNE